MTGKNPNPQAEQDELDALKEDLAALRGDVSELAASLREFVQQAGTQSGRPAGTDSTAEAGDSAGDTARDTADVDTETIEDQWQEFKRKLEETRVHGRQTLQDVSEEVTRHPLASIAVAFGLGYITARLFKLLSWK